MKIVIALLLLSLPMVSVAQIHRTYTRPEPVWEYLVKGGWQYNSFTNSGFDASFSGGWNVGFALKIPVKGALWIYPEIAYSKRSAVLTYPQQASASANQATYSFTYVTYPLLLAYRPNDILEFHAGPQLGVLLGYDVKFSDQQQNSSRLSPSELAKWEYAAVGGLEINMSPLAFGARYIYSLQKIANTALAEEQLGDASLHGVQLYGALVF